MRSLAKILFAVIILTVYGCGMVPISVKYHPSGALQKQVQGYPQVSLQVNDARTKKVFFRNALGEGKDSGEGSVLKLTDSPVDTVYRGFSEALQRAGYALLDNAPIVYEVEIKKFLVVQNQFSTGYDTDIILDVIIKKDGEILAKKSFFQQDTSESSPFTPMQNVIPKLFNHSVSQAIDNAAQDDYLTGAIGGTSITKKLAEPTYTQTTLTTPSADSVNKETERLRAISASEIPKKKKEKNIALARESEDSATQPDSFSAEKAKGTTDDLNFVERVQSQLAHHIPEDVSKGLWLATVPRNLDVFAFPSTVRDLRKLSLLRSWTKLDSLHPYHLGKTPLHVVLKPGSYTIVFVHQPIPDDIFKLRYHQGHPIFPFIASSGAGYVFAGDINDPLNGIAWPPDTGDHFYWTQERDFTTKTELSTMLVLFQREDQPISRLLKDIPDRQNFLFTARDHLRKLSIKDQSLYLTEKEIAEAEGALRRGGVWAKRVDDQLSLSLEMQGNGGALARLHPPEKWFVFYARGRFVGGGSDGKKVVTKQLLKPLPAQPQPHESVPTDSQGVSPGRFEDDPVSEDLVINSAVKGTVAHEIINNLPKDGIYSHHLEDKSTYKDPLHGFFMAQAPAGFRIDVKRNKMTVTVQPGRPRAGEKVQRSWINFKQRNIEIGVIARETWSELEDDFNMTIDLYKNKGLEILLKRYVMIDGVKGGEYIFKNNRIFFHGIKYKKHGLDHSISCFSSSPRGYQKYQKQCINFLRSYRGLKP